MKFAFSLLAALLVLLPASTGVAANGAELDPAGAANVKAASPVTYRKKVAATRFHVVNSLQVEDIADIWSGYPLELLRRLGRTHIGKQPVTPQELRFEQLRINLNRPVDRGPRGGQIE